MDEENDWLPADLTPDNDYSDDTAIIRKAALEIAVLDAEIKELQERKDALKSFFKDGDKYPPGKYDFGDVELVVSTNQRISDKRAVTTVTPQQWVKITYPKVDPKLARRYLDDATLNKVMDKYDNRIEIRIKENS